MKKFIITSLLVFLTSVVGFAAGKKKVTKTVTTIIEEVDSDESERPKEQSQEQSTPKIIENKDFIVEDSSRFNRMNLKYTVWSQLLGIGPSLSSSNGLAFGYYYTSDDIFFIEATRGTEFFSSDSSHTESNYDIVTKSLGFHWKHFTGNSFYLNTGIDFRSVDYAYKNTITPTDSSFDSTSTIVSFAIGNQWQWKSFTLGCDWIGISLPIAHDVTNAKITTSSSYEEDEFKKDQDTFSSKTHGQALRFYLGASF